jgi:PAS domain S-box-containing protein
MNDFAFELSSKQLFKIIDNCWDSILIIDRSSRVLYANSAFLMLIGYSRDKVVGAPFELFLKNKYQEAFEKILNNIQSATVQSFINVICTSKDNHEIGLHIGMQLLGKDDLVVLNIKQTQEPQLKEHAEELSASKMEALERSVKTEAKKEENNFFGKTMGWLGEANKAIDSMFHQEDKKKVKTKSKSPASRLKRSSDSSHAWLPKGVDVLNLEQLKELVRDEVDTFTSIEYSIKTQEELIAAKEWHTWQVSLMLKFYYSGGKLFIPDKEKYFPQFIKDLSKNAQEQVIKNMIKNVKKRANIGAKKEVLEKDAKWSAFEVACLIYFILE